MTRVDCRVPEPVVLNDVSYPPWSFHVLFNGENVSRQCFLADDETGEVGLYRVDASGHFYVDSETGEPAREFRRGTIVLIALEPAPGRDPAANS